MAPGWALAATQHRQSAIANSRVSITFVIWAVASRGFRMRSEAGPCAVLRLDYISCLLTVLSTVLIGKRYWHGWILAGVNSVVICVIARNTAQFGFIPANVFCLGLYVYNVWNWRKPEAAPPHPRH